MEWIASKENVLEVAKKYRYVALALVVGIFLMLLPEKETAPAIQTPVEATVQPTLEQSLSEVLSMVSGAGKVKVLLTQAAGELVLYQTDEDSTRSETVLVSNPDREETGLVRQIHPPTYRGAIVLCQGADRAEVRLSIMEAVCRVTGLTSDKIAVLKMK